MSFSDVLEGEVLDWIFNRVTGSGNEPTQGTHLAVFSANPEAAADTSATGGFTSAQFNRIDITTAGPGSTNLFDRTDNQVWNNSTVTFTNSSGAQQNITHVVLVDGTGSAAKVIAHAELTPARDVPDAADLEFAGDGMQTGAAITFTLS
jgi:hypothetical protein